jgi:hypothetical protein
MRRSIGTLAMVAATVTLVGCAQKPPGAVSVIEDKTYTVTPSSVPVSAGIVVGELTELKVTERVEQGSGRIETPARLSGTLKLKNTSKDQTVRLIGADLRYIDKAGQVIKLEDERTAPTIRFSTAKSDRLDPGQETNDAVLVDFPAEALKQNTLKDISLAITYLPSAYRHETVNLAVSIGSP